MFCRRLSRGRRLSLHGANTGKSDCEEESKESFSHGRERNQPRDYNQRISEGSRFSAGKDSKTAAPLHFTTPGNSDASAEADGADSESFR